MSSPLRGKDGIGKEPLLSGSERVSLNADPDDICDLPPVRKNRGMSISGRSIRSGLFPEEYDACYRTLPDGTTARTPGRSSARAGGPTSGSVDSDGSAAVGSEAGPRSRSESSWKALFGPQTYTDLVDDLHDQPQMKDLAHLCLAVAACCSHVFLALRIDGYVEWDWISVLLPEVAAGLAVIVLLVGEVVALLLGRGWARAARRVVRLSAVVVAIVLALLSLWLIVTRVKRGPGEGRSFVLAFMPIYAVQLGVLGRDITFFARKTYKWATGRGSPKPFLKRLPRVMLFILQLPIIAFTIVLPIALESYGSDSPRNFWWVSFTPLWVFMPLLVIVICFSTGKAALADVAYAVAVIAFILVPWTVFLYRLCSHLQAVADAAAAAAAEGEDGRGTVGGSGGEAGEDDPGAPVPIDFVWTSVPCFVSYGCIIVFLTGRILTRAAAQKYQFKLPSIRSPSSTKA